MASSSSLASWAGPPPLSSNRPSHSPTKFSRGGGGGAPSTEYGYSHMVPVRQQRPRTPPESVGIRRVRSFGSSMAPSSTQHIYPAGALPPSPDSPSFRGLALQPPPPGNGGADPTWFAASRDAWINANQPGPPPSAALPAFANVPPQPSPPNRRKRNASAEAAYATPASQQRATYAPQDQLSVAIPEYAAPGMSYSLTTPTGGKNFQQPTAEEVSKFFQEMTELLGEDTMSALSPTSPSNAYPALSLSATPDRAASTSTSSATAAPPAQPPFEKTYNVSGILLSEDEYRQYAASPSANRQPSPAQYFVPPGNTYQPPPSDTYTTSLAPPPPFYGQSAYGYELQRPQSAPPTPAVEAPSAFPLQAPMPAPPPPPRPSASLRHRRGSSLDLSAIPRSIPSGLSVPSSYYPVPSNPHHPRPPPSYAQQYPPPSHFNYPPPSSAYQTPTRPPHGDYAPFAYPGPAPSRPYQHPPSPPPTASSSSFPVTPSKPAGGRGHQRKKSGGVAFINFSAADSKALLTGVAPSGSAKKRQREEDEAAAMREREGKRMAVE
ncbi:hypothetical protein JCM6882_002592 [Rhodosporidiobolus microsporus]